LCRAHCRATARFGGCIFTILGILKVDDADAVRGPALCPAIELPGEDHEFVAGIPATIVAIGRSWRKG
jgi:hypothetical protein